MKDISVNRGNIYKIIAFSLIIMSFVLYAIMPFNACLPFSACIIAGITGLMMILSEIIFWIGSLMLGREALKRFKNKFSIISIIKRRKERKQVK
jgi:hypothetical protein